MVSVGFCVGGRLRPVYLKLEGFNPAGSIKDRVAASLILDLEERGALKGPSSIIESTSGNLGVALAMLCRDLGHSFIAVIDPKTPVEKRDQLVNLGARLEIVTERDESGSYLLCRLRRVQEICESHPEHLWTNQYANPANPRAHYLGTAPEVYRQMDGEMDAVFVAVSTGGTLAGVGSYLREYSPRTRVIAVDAVGSVVFGQAPAQRYLTGIGSSCTSPFVMPTNYDHVEFVTDAAAFSFCRELFLATGIKVGGSSGAVLSACARYLVENPGLSRVVCLCPDSGEHYDSTIFNDDWLHHRGLDGCPLPLVEKIIPLEASEPKGHIVK